MFHKTFSGVEFKSAGADRGEVRAIFSRFDAVDRDGDYTLPGAFDQGAEVPISAFQHGSWNGILPVGKGVIHADNEVATVDATLFLATQSGREHFEVMKQLGSMLEWSYGYDVLDSDVDTVDGQRVRVLRRLKVHEISPVMIGAGVRTQTVTAKDDDVDAIYREWAITRDVNMTAELERSRFLLNEFVN